MITLLYVVQFVITTLLILIIMFQKSEGGTGLISSNPYNSFFSSKSMSANPLTKITIILGSLLFINSILIGGVHISKASKQDSVIEKLEALQKEKAQETKNNDVPLGK